MLELTKEFMQSGRLSNFTDQKTFRVSGVLDEILYLNYHPEDASISRLTASIFWDVFLLIGKKQATLALQDSKTVFWGQAQDENLNPSNAKTTLKGAGFSTWGAAVNK